MSLRGIKRRIWWYMVNRVYVGVRKFEQKRKLLNKLGHEIGEGTKVVGPVICTGRLIIGENTWVGKNLAVNGNGTVRIGSNCDLAPDVVFQTGSHEIGSSDRRAGAGCNQDIVVGNGCWLGIRSTVLGGVHIGDGSVVAACGCVCKDVESNVLVGGVPAKVIRKLEHHETIS